MSADGEQDQVVANESFLLGGGEGGPLAFMVTQHGIGNAFVIPKGKIKVYEASFHFLVPNLWNSFPTSVYLGPSGEYISVNAFKFRLRGLLTAG